MELSPEEVARRLLGVLLLGAVIGLERELTGQAAGLRTHISVALGAALFGMVSAYSFSEFNGPRDASSYQIDVTRVASNVVTGVGFLGGGAILKHGASVRGLTTAASLWVTAAVGLAVALGGFTAAAMTTGALLVSNVALRGPRTFLRRHARGRQQVILHLRADARVADVVSALHELADVDVRSLSMSRDREGPVIEADVRGSDLEARLAPLADRHDVADLDIG